MSSAKRNILSAMADQAGYLALWPALYLVSVCILLAELSGLPMPGLASALSLFTLAISVYLTDRVKLADRFEDPADAVTHPNRHAWVWSHRRLLRLVAFIAFAVSMTAGYLVHPLLVAAPLLGQVAVFIYGGMPSGSSHRFARIKDITLVKNIAGGLGHTTIAGLTLWLANPLSSPTDLLIPAAVICTLIVADCMLCDVGDAPGDRQFKTLTIPALFGGLVGRILSSVLVLGCAVWIWLSTSAWGGFLASALVASQLVLLEIPSAWIRNATDIRLPLLTLVVFLFSGDGMHILAA